MTETELEQHLRSCAYRLFLRSGYQQVSMAQIADAAGVCEQVVHRHFPHKETFLDDSPNGSTMVVSNFVAQPEDLDPKTALSRAVTETISSFDVGYGHSDLLDVWRKIVAGAPRSVQQSVLINGLAKEALIVELARRMGVGRHESLQPAILIGIVIGATYVVFEHWVATQDPTPLAQLCGEALSFAGFISD